MILRNPVQVDQGHKVLDCDYAFCGELAAIDVVHIPLGFLHDLCRWSSAASGFGAESMTHALALNRSADVATFPPAKVPVRSDLNDRSGLLSLHLLVLSFSVQAERAGSNHTGGRPGSWHNFLLPVSLDPLRELGRLPSKSDVSAETDMGNSFFPRHALPSVSKNPRCGQH